MSKLPDCINNIPQCMSCRENGKSRNVFSGSSYCGKTCLTTPTKNVPRCSKCQKNCCYDYDLQKFHNFCGKGCASKK